MLAAVGALKMRPTRVLSASWPSPPPGPIHLPRIVFRSLRCPRPAVGTGTGLKSITPPGAVEVKARPH